MIEKEIKSIIQNIIPNSRVLLFGSRARKTNRPNSDYDIFIIAPSPLNNEEKKSLRKTIRLHLAKLCLGFDIILESINEAEVKKNIYGTVAREAFTHGIEL